MMRSKNTERDKNILNDIKLGMGIKDVAYKYSLTENRIKSIAHNSDIYSINLPEGRVMTELLKNNLLEMYEYIGEEKTLYNILVKGNILSLAKLISKIKDDTIRDVKGIGSINYRYLVDTVSGRGI